LAISNNSKDIKKEHFVKAARLVREGRNILQQFEDENKDKLNYLG